MALRPPGIVRLSLLQKHDAQPLWPLQNLSAFPLQHQGHISISLFSSLVKDPRSQHYYFSLCRPNPGNEGRTFGSNTAGSWGYQNVAGFKDGDVREVVTIYEASTSRCDALSRFVHML